MPREKSQPIQPAFHWAPPVRHAVSAGKVFPYSGGESKPEEVNRCPQITNTELGCHEGTGKCGAHGHRRLGWGTQALRLSLRSGTQAGLLWRPAAAVRGRAGKAGAKSSRQCSGGSLGFIWKALQSQWCVCKRTIIWVGLSFLPLLQLCRQRRWEKRRQEAS